MLNLIAHLHTPKDHVRDRTVDRRDYDPPAFPSAFADRTTSPAPLAIAGAPAHIDRTMPLSSNKANLGTVANRIVPIGTLRTTSGSIAETSTK
jgi:hypothetical protein